MEFPHIGKNCSYNTCNKLDFLPMKCDACQEVYCADHFSYVKHDCPESGRRDVQVPACPLCGVPVPGIRGQPPDVAVGAHIDNQCTSDPARERRNKVFTNRCSYKGCKTKEMVRVECKECDLNYCLRHRHTADHQCQGRLAAKRRQAAEAAMARIKASESGRLGVASPSAAAAATAFAAVQGNMKRILRVQGPEGIVRVEVSTDDSMATLRQRVASTTGLRGPFELSRDQEGLDLLPNGDTSLQKIHLQHGDVIYIKPVIEAQSSTSSYSEQDSHVVPSMEQSRTLPAEDQVDLELYQEDGSIERQRDGKLCRHNYNGRCVHCTPLEPWDEGYLKEQKIKHMSFHSYLRKITSGKFVSLEEVSCKIRSGCHVHPPWPRGVCSSCQPPAVTLTRQVYRHVDNVLIEHPQIVERFLQYWRSTGQQRVGWLYGRYERHPSVPLGVRACVAAIYEPPQFGDRDSVLLVENDPNEAALEYIAIRLGLRRVGWLFTDLLVDELSRGTVKRVRGAHSHFLSAQECVTAGYFQNLHPNPCRHAPTGYFGSKFVTVCVTGSTEGQVILEGYQVSGQCAALVRDNVLVPTKDAPDLGYVKESSDSQFVPDVLYSKRDSYGNEVRSTARRLPIDYVLVDVPAGVATSPQPSLQPVLDLSKALPPANRLATPQSLQALQKHLDAAPSFLSAISDLHVLLYLATNEALPLPLSALDPLLDAVVSADSSKAEQAAQAPQLATLLALARASSEGSDPGAHQPSLAWSCQLCTYHNEGAHDACQMCAMPKNGA